MTLVIVPDAIQDLDEIYDYIERDRPPAAEQVLNRLVTTFQRLADSELSGPAVRLIDGRRVQKWSVPPYRIYYQRTAAQTLILRVYHQVRRPIER